MLLKCTVSTMDLRGRCQLATPQQISGGSNATGWTAVPISDISPTEVNINYHKRTKANLLRSFPELEEPGNTRNYDIQISGDVERFFKLYAVQYDSGRNSHYYEVRTNSAPNAPELTNIEAQFIQCVREIERIEEAQEKFANTI